MLPRLVASLRAIVEQLDTISQKRMPEPPRSSGHRARHLAAVDYVGVLVSRGMPELDALLRAANRHAVDLALLGEAWKLHSRQRAAHDLHARRLLVQFLTEQRWKDADIARLLSVHPKHVPRMRRAMREPAEDAAQGEEAAKFPAKDGRSPTGDDDDDR